MKKIAVALLFLAAFCDAAEPRELIKVSVTGENVNIRSAPSTKGKILEQAAYGMDFIVESDVIQDKSDRSVWYKIVFFVSEMDGSFTQAHKMSVFEFAYPYINARYVRQEPFTQEDEDELEWFMQGRPPRIVTGDDLSEEMEDADRFVLKAQVVLRKEPRMDAGTIVVPAGTVIYLHYATEMFVHNDLDEVSWTYMVGEDNKVIGWQLMEEAKELPIDPPF